MEVKLTMKFMTIEEVAKYLRLKKQKLYTFAQRGDIPAYKFGREWRFKKDRLEQWIEEHENTNHKGKGQPNV